VLSSEAKSWKGPRGCQEAVVDVLEEVRTMKRLIPVTLAAIALFALAPLSCSQDKAECEWREVARFTPSGSQVLFGYSGETDTFSTNQERLRITSISNISDTAPASILSGSFSIDLYHYPDMKLVKRVVDETALGKEQVYRNVEVEVDKGMYCLYVSNSTYVLWGVQVHECA
jgi:hypothetical protein